MDKLALVAEPFLGGYESNLGTISILEMTKIKIFSIALPNGSEKKAEKAIFSEYGIKVPKVGMSCLDIEKKNRFMSLASDQIFLICEDNLIAPISLLELDKRLNNNAYITDQSDVWVCLKFSGPNVIKALERICPINLHEKNFPINSSARTVMEHLAVIIIRISQDDYYLISASSSAQSFLLAVETSVKNTI